MTDTRFTPEEFARLLALPADHPERRRAEADPRFDAWQRMLHAFESRESHGLSAEEFRAADAELASRMERELAMSGSPRPVRRAIELGGEKRSLWSWLFPSWAPAVAVAAALVIGGVWIYSVRSPDERVVRGNAAALEITMHRGGVLTWTPVQGAEKYRVVFYGADLRQIASVEDVMASRLDLRADQIPLDLPWGQEVAVQVIALRGGATVGESRTATVKLPSK